MSERLTLTSVVGRTTETEGESGNNDKSKQ